MKTLCKDCNISSTNFINSSIECRESNQKTYFSSDFIYSNSAGTVTANTLIHRFQIWILSENKPVLTVDGKQYYLNKKCTSIVTSVTRMACMSVFTASPGAASQTHPSTIAGVFTAGVSIGIIASAAIVVAVIW